MTGMFCWILKCEGQVKLYPNSVYCTLLVKCTFCAWCTFFWRNWLYIASKSNIAKLFLKAIMRDWIYMIFVLSLMCFMQGNEFTFPSLNIKILNKNQSQQGMQKKITRTQSWSITEHKSFISMLVNFVQCNIWSVYVKLYHIQCMSQF